jgi:putative colanic acid biosynthesis acetyltransferase WcaF
MPDTDPIDDQLASRAQSPWSLGSRVRRVIWMFVRATAFRCSFHNWYRWRSLLLRCFGARVGHGVRVRPSVHVEIPWNLALADGVVVGDHAILYSLGEITVGRNTVISQYAHLCAGTHDYTKRSFPLLRLPIRIGEDVWVAADAFVGPGVTVGDRAVVAARTTVVKDVAPDQVVAGNPARFIKLRELQ